MRFASIILVGLFTLVGCGPKVAPNAARLGVVYSWSKENQCSSKSPAIQLTGLPASATRVKVSLADLDVPSWDHGGSTLAVPADGLVPAGALSGGYNGPCPPSGTHAYVFDVKALDATGTVVGMGKQKQDCCNF